MTTLRDFTATPASTGTRSIVAGDNPMPQKITLKDMIGYREPKTWQKVLGIIGDGLQIAGGGRASYMPGIQAERQRQQEFEQAWNLAEMQGQRENARWLGQKQWEREHPAPTDLENYMRAAGIDPASDEGKGMFKQKAQNTANPPVWRQGPDMQFYRVDVGNRPAIGSTVPMPRRTDQYGNSPQASDQAARMRAQLVERFGPARGESEFQKWLQAFNGGQ